jgi:hypothetical protein
MKKHNKINSTISCKATAALKVAVAEDLNKEDKNLEELLNAKEQNRKISDSVCEENTD